MSGANGQAALDGLRDRIRSELLERLQFFSLEPRVIIDLGCGAGEGAAALRKKYRRAQVVAIDMALAMAQAARRRHRFWRRSDAVCADARALPLRAQCVDLVFCNLLLPHCTDPPALFTQVRHVLRPGGLVLFSTLGPDTAVELHAGGQPDMPRLGAAMSASGLSEPVLDLERHPAAGQSGSWEVIYGAAFAGITAPDAVGTGVGSEFLVPVGALRPRRQSR